MRITNFVTLISVLIVFSPLNSLAQGPIGGFMPKAGELDVAAAYSYESFDTYFLEEGSEARNLITRSYNLFAEYGLNANSALVATLPYIYTQDDNRGLQDASLWLKYRNSYSQAATGTHSVITAVGLSFPLSNYPVDNSAAIGRRATVFQGRLVYQFNHESGWFIHGQSGIDFQIAPDALAAWPLLVRTGFGGPYFYVEAWYELVRSLETSEQGAAAIGGTGSNWNRLGATLYIPLTPWFGLVGGGAYILSGSFIGQATRWNVGGVWKINARQSD